MDGATGALAGQVALVTGASRGLGAATAIELARRGAQVVIVARTVGGLAEVDDVVAGLGGACTLLPLDLREGEQVDALGPSLHNRFGRLDILVHAAGVLGKLTPVPHITARDWDATVAVNMSATWRLIRSCAPLLQAAPAGRAVFVTSGAARRHAPYWAAYGATKAGMEHLVLSWAAETANISPLRTNLFSPGPVATRMRMEAFPGEDPATLPSPEAVALDLAALCGPDEVRHGEVIRAGQG